MRYFVGLLTILLFLPAMANAQFNIIPQRVVIGPNERSGEITIFNMSNESAVVALSIRHSEPLPNGGYNYLEEPLYSVFNPEDYVRFTPRQFEIGPNGRQKVRLSIRKPQNLPEGSYHFHIRSARYAVYEPRQVEQNIGVGMALNVAFNAPVIIHHGRVKHGMKIESVEILEQEAFNLKADALQFRLIPDGNAVSLAVAKALWEPADGSEPYQIGLAGNVFMFPNLTHRDLRMVLQRNIPDEAGQIRVIVYDDYNPGAIFDEIVLNP